MLKTIEKQISTLKTEKMILSESLENTQEVSVEVMKLKNEVKQLKEQERSHIEL
jgi:conjugal transfer/entry exclusion protein